MKLTGDHALQERVEVRTGIRLILTRCLTDGFHMLPSLLVTDGSCMIERWIGIYGHPLEIQVSYECSLSLHMSGSRNLQLLHGEFNYGNDLQSCFLFRTA